MTEREIFDFTDTYISRLQTKSKVQETEETLSPSLQNNQPESLSGAQFSSGAFVADPTALE